MDLKYAAGWASGRMEFKFTIFLSFEENSFVDLFKMFIKWKQFPDKQIMKDKSIRLIINENTRALTWTGFV